MFPKPTKKIKEKKPLKRKSSSPLKKAKDKAWIAFSLYIRTKYKNPDGTLTCYTCEKTFPFKGMTAGHGIGGRNNAVLLLEQVVRPQCVGCNVWGRGQYRIFTLKLIEELGLEEYGQLAKISDETVIFKVADWEDKERIYLALLKNL